ncbi:MAG: glyoxylate/hydroxypyruvate reductase A [Marinifilaceae bacterium]
MSILLVFENKDVSPWVKMLKAKLPETSIEIYPDVKDKAAVDFVICWKPKKNAFAEFPNIKVIQSVGASIDHITNSQVLNKDEIVTRIVDHRLSHDMWEFTLSIVLAQQKNLKTYLHKQDSKEWKPKDYKSTDKTIVSIMGLGSIGAHVAEQFALFGFKVKGWSNSPKEISNVESFSGKEELNTFLNDSDFLINLLPLTKETENILNKPTLQQLPNHSFLINVGRGEHLVESDLIELLDSSMLSGAFLDVFRTEPLPNNHPFWSHPKIQITPHIASLTNVESATSQIIENYNRFLNKKELLNTVSLSKGY